MRRRARSAASDLLIVAGMAAVVYGVAQWSVAAAWVLGGVAAMGVGAVLAWMETE